MDRRRQQRRVGNRNRTGNTTSAKEPNRRIGGLRRNRRNRRVGQGNRRNRLERAQGALRSGPRNNRRRFGRFGRFYQRRRRNNRLRKVFVGGLPRFVTNRQLYNLFRGEGRITYYRIAYDRYGYSRGWGEIEFLNPRDAWKSIRKWNNTTYRGSLIRVEYRRRRPRRNNNRFGGFGGRRGYFGGNRGGFNRGYGYGGNRNRGRY